MKRLGALEALGRGLSNVRGNLEVVAVSVAALLGTFAIVLLSVLPWLGSSILASLRDGAEPLRPEEVTAWLERLGSSRELLSRLGVATLALFVGLTVASILYCWVWGGVLAVLHAGDAQAPPGSGREAPLFRTWSRRFFVLEATRLTWKLMVFLSLFFGLLLFVALAFVVLAVAAALVVARSGGAAGLALGCGGSLPLLFVYFAISGAMWVGQVELVRPEVSTGGAARTGFALLGRRLGACMAIFALFFAASLAVALLFGGLAFLFRFALAARPVAATTVGLAISLFQLVLSAALQAALAATFIALARSERGAASPVDGTMSAVAPGAGA